MADISIAVLDQLEVRALESLVKAAKEGNSTAASQALIAVQRIREKGGASLHRERMRELDSDPCAMAYYLATLGLKEEEVTTRLGRPLTREETAFWERGQEDRLLEVRAIELQNMRRGGDVPKWATRRT